jgi:hypothetical protein
MTTCDLGLGAPPGEFEIICFQYVSVLTGYCDRQSLMGVIYSHRKTLITEATVFRVTAELPLLRS